MAFDAVVVGSGPNGLAAAIVLQKHGLQTLLVEQAATIGGGLRSGSPMSPNVIHDICSAVHPMALASPLFRALPLDRFGLEYITPEYCVAHPLDNGETAIMHRSLDKTADALGIDSQSYRDLIVPMIKSWNELVDDILAPPIHVPAAPAAFLTFALRAVKSVKGLSGRFRTDKAKALWAGLAAHSMLPFNKMSSAAIGLVLATAGHVSGWPIVKGGSQKLADALAAYFRSLGGSIQTHFSVTSLNQLPASKVILFDVSPNHLADIVGDRLSARYTQKLLSFKRGPGAFKVDFELSEPIPFKDTICRNVSTVHLGGSYREIESYEASTWTKTHVGNNPFVLLVQQSALDPTRSISGIQTAWAYCHVPYGSDQDMAASIEQQIERFAPGFKDTIIARHVTTPADLERYNPNYVGGDINGGAVNFYQLIARPTLQLNPYRTAAKGIYLCSASTPPGGGVHGMCGYHAAATALRDEFDIVLQ